jgi:O-antigen ligase
MVINNNKWAGWIAVAIGFSIPISTSLDNILLALLLALWLLEGRFREKVSAALDNPIVIPALMLFVIYVLGLFYGVATWHDALGSLKKAANLLLILVMIPIFKEEKLRHFAIWGFLGAVSLTMLLSYLIWVGVIEPNNFFKGDQDEPVVFKLRITHSLLMAYAAYLFLLKARQCISKPSGILFGVLALAALYNVFFMVASKTSYIVALALVVYFIVSHWSWRSTGIAVLFLMILFGTIYKLPSSTPHQRVLLMYNEAKQWQPGQSDHSSTGDRLEFLTNSLRLIRENPIWGAGTGGFKGAYASLVKDTKMDPSDNPHNEYLMVTVQTGVMGLGLMLWLFAAQWRAAPLLSDRFDCFAARGLVILIMSASLVTSTLIDHTEGLFYVWMSALLFAGWKSAGDQGARPCHSPL